MLEKNCKSLSICYMSDIMILQLVYPSQVSTPPRAAVLTRTKLSPSNLTLFALNDVGSSRILSVIMVRQLLVLVAKSMYMSVPLGMSISLLLNYNKI